MKKVTLTPVDNITGCPFPEKEKYYKIYNDGGHYVAKEYFHSYQKRRSEETPLDKVFDLYYNEALLRQRKKERCLKADRKPLNTDEFIRYVTPILKARFPQSGVTEQMIVRMIARKKENFLPKRKTSGASAIDTAFDSLYKNAVRNGFKGDELTENVKTGLLKLFSERGDLDKYISEKLEKEQRNLYARKKRFRRKGALNRWNYFVTFTYNDRLHTAETFRKKLRKCLSNLHTRRGWRYMGVFEEAPETGRLHFHGLFYIPDGEMIGTITEEQDYSERQGKMQVTYSNDFFKKNFGKNDFEELNAMELKCGQTLNYILKYIGKTGERIIYSRGIPTEICKKISEREIATEMTDYVKKFVLFDDAIEWERDIMHYTKFKQITIIDVLCNPPRTA